jgi:methionyl-tRNA synthetase
MARILITSALPYINGVKHLGNLVGSQLPADVYARFARARGHEVMFICATDEHGTPAELAAAKTGEPVAEYCARLWTVQKDLADGFRLVRPFRAVVVAAEPPADAAFRRAALTRPG